MTTFTKEQLTEIIAAANEVITALADENEDLSQSNTTGMIRAYDYLNDDAAPPEVVKRLAEIALAAMQQEHQRTVSTAKNLTISLPDTSSKAFWSATGKSEVFHPDTYRRWVKEAIERDCTIAGIEVKVK
ncbi:hypothetical protein [Yokenella regensburgei]|uniref:hypothetical protein n=1 Tax=Yokenella regensburgei TaxID=158877 RepID=UPI001ED92324|nr:hypothetical protein [Yokenella regensburgei]KAF1368758.1 hypothetical protein FHR25_002508 [Yokenella regensburgei]